MTNKIGWCDMTINPIVGCTKCSPGCDNCYAEKRAALLASSPATRGLYEFLTEDGRWTGDWEDNFSCFSKLPKSKHQFIFACSMGDMFHEYIPPLIIHDILDKMRTNSQHTFLLLTKRAKNMREVISSYSKALPNVWLGVTICNQQEVDEKIPILLSIPAAKRFVSIEPMLGAIKLNGHLTRWNKEDGMGNALDWVICGGETGKNARPMLPKWVLSLRDECSYTRMRVPFWFKGWGDNSVYRGSLLPTEENQHTSNWTECKERPRS